MSKILSFQPNYNFGITSVQDDNIQDSVDIGYRVTANFGYYTADILWPRSRMLGSPAITDNAALVYNFWSWTMQRLGGTQTRTQVTGQVQFANGTAANAATINLFDTPTQILVDTSTTDSGGYYYIGSPYSTNVYVIGYLSGSPDTMGTTINTIPG